MLEGAQEKTADIALLAKSKRIAIISDALLERNGVGAYYKDLIDHMQTHVDAIEIYCPRKNVKEWFSMALPSDATQVISLPSPRNLSKHLGLLKPDLIVLATPGPWGLLGARYARKHAVSAIVGFHTHFEALMDIYWKKLFGKIAQSYFWVSNRYLFKRSQLVVANSERVAESARKMGAKHVEVIGTFIAKPFIDKPLVALDKDLKKVLFVGRLALEKNLDAYLKAATALPDMTFSLAGDGPLRGKVDDAAASIKNIDVLGWQPREALIDIIDSHDLLVLPSFVESFGTVALEAMARGKLVLVSNQCGITQWPQLNQALFTFDLNGSLADAIQKIKSLPSDERVARSDRAHHAAVNLVSSSLNGWLDIIRRYATSQKAA